MGFCFLFLFVFSSFALNCSFEKGVPVPFDDVISCFNQVPLTKESFEQSMDTLERTAQLYVFRDVSKQSPSPVFAPLNLDLDAELAKIRRTNFTSEFAFNNAVVNLFTLFRDGHLAYVPPSCFSGFTATQPFTLVSYFDKKDAEEKIYIADVIGPEKYSTLFGIENLDKYIGGIITHINGFRAVNEIMKFANSSIGSTRDVNGRFNLALARFADGSGSYYPGKFSSRGYTSILPQYGESITYTILSGGVSSNVTLKWIATPTRAVSSLDSLISECRTVPKLPLLRSTKGMIYDDTERVKLSKKARTIHSTIPRSFKRSSDVTVEPLLIANDIQFYKIDAETAVIVFPSFMADKRIEFIRALREGFQVMADKGLHRVIIDISNNGGGNICLGYTLARMLIPEYSPYGVNDMPVVPLSLAFAQAAIDNNVHGTFWSPDSWHQANSNDTFPFNMDWFVPGVNHTRGGVEGTYSQLFRDSCDIYFDVFNPPRVFKPSEIKIITNGYCASTCALFSRHLQEVYKVSTFAIGGVSYIPMAIANCPGGQVLDSDETLKTASKLGMKNHPLSPPGFPNDALMTYTMREVYPWQGTARDIPLDFFFQPATYHLGYTKESAMNPQKAWEQVLEFFV